MVGALDANERRSLAEPHRVAARDVAFSVGDEFVTGAVLRVGGGQVLVGAPPRRARVKGGG